MLKDSDDIARFASTAAPGSWETYGRGDHPPRDMVRAMRPYVESGALVPTSKREAAGMLYMVRRGRGALPPRSAAKRGTWRQRGKTDLGRVLTCLVRAACRGTVCPTYSDIAQRCGLSRRTARYRVEQLIKAGRIAAEHDLHTGWRVVTILVGPHAGKATMAAPVHQSNEGDRCDSGC